MLGADICIHGDRFEVLNNERSITQICTYVYVRTCSLTNTFNGSSYVHTSSLSSLTCSMTAKSRSFTVDSSLKAVGEMATVSGGDGHGRFIHGCMAIFH